MWCIVTRLWSGVDSVCRRLWSHRVPLDRQRLLRKRKSESDECRRLTKVSHVADFRYDGVEIFSEGSIVDLLVIGDNHVLGISSCRDECLGEENSLNLLLWTSCCSWRRCLRNLPRVCSLLLPRNTRDHRYLVPWSDLCLSHASPHRSGHWLAMELSKVSHRCPSILDDGHSLLGAGPLPVGRTLLSTG